ncbi:MAG TPA: DNA recombination protein RmuC [Aliidongia sp.]|nr:DNA recombination protein RmuC [Aliidongia sp.]
MDVTSLALAALIGLVLGGAIAALWVRHGVAEARAAASADLELRAAASVRLEEALAKAVRLEAQAEAALEARDAALAARARAETEAALARQETETMAARMRDWEATKAEFLSSTKAGVLETAQQISSKLIEDHKRETAEAKEAAEKQVKATTEALRLEMKDLTDGVSQLKGQVAERAVVLDTVWRALSSPAGAGYFAEVGLANTLKSFGLAQERDFVLQATVYDEEAVRKRPDALVFLPGDAVLVIDSKASKHLLDLAQAEGTERQDEAYRNLARTMNQHLKDLTDRDYRGAVQAGYRKAGRSSEISRLMTVMYLPNDAALEKLGHADPSFMQKAARAEIVLAGPSGLAAIVGFASVEISLMRQIENQEKIVAGTERLLDALATAVGYAGSVGKGIRSAADAFAKLSNSLNSRVLPRAREVTRLGLRPGKPVPDNLPAYQVLDLGAETIEGEATGLAEMPALGP